MEYIIGIAVMLSLVILVKSPLGHDFQKKWIYYILFGKNRPQKDWFVLHDVSFYDSTKSVVIDHIIVNTSGIHVIGMFAEQGHITGGEYDKLWEITTHYGKTSVTMKNPVYQINDQVLSLKQVIPIKVSVYGYVCFNQHVKLKVKSKIITVTSLRPLIKHIKVKNKATKPLKPIEVRNLYEAIKDLRKKTFKHQPITIENTPKKAHQKDL
ncbi:MAG: hypothetical protein A2Y45_03695 [Tenericutes bacterium GWC2_34_14]|nr:MAG: hypothetical protein US32_C0002G0022 [candidate division TM6 bacterium GW2011_GWA2_36_9]OHE29238.1 MAG: hypothetical protein A2Y45_03695 [Tenericutes bacterium GWC2_34_14]OHE34321.1 MAG: hypothetical protein A2012_09285 [Tenericutes bacterium GWE2_34_108]OHE35673.1 MAG: hypothetical protein A2Y46_06050 [Tenericutes bacterium GWF1_35_14]OHE38888.1 MAG: hypothetical protein A2Y44_00485 [Tenericutes bacterium GWF2_35_184]OHE43920.1 MAG: hypothetical protein A2221_10380 [Tenericutes bacter